MDHPYYTVTVTNLTRGWSYAAVEGDEWDPADDVVLISPFTYGWGFDGELIPGQLDTFFAGVNMVARSASDVPEVQIGDLVTVDVRVGTSGARVLAPPPMRVTAAETELIPKREYPARLALSMVDLSADWSALETLGVRSNSPYAARSHWRDRLAEIGSIFGFSIGSPTWWADEEVPAGWASGTNFLRTYHGDEYPKKFRDALIRVLNAHQPDGIYHSIATIYGDAHPSGYEYVGPDTWYSAGGYSPLVIPDPGSSMRLELVPASRVLPGSAGLPLQFHVDASSGILELVPRTPASGNAAAQIAFNADWCVIPATARRAREHAVNQINLAGWTTSTTEQFEYVYQYENSGDIAARGLSAREVPTDLLIGTAPADDAPPSSIFSYAPLAASRFLSDDSVLAAPWSFDGFTVLSSLIPQDVAAWLLPLIPPRLPGETDGDGRLVRSVTIFDIDDSVRFDGNPVTGFITAGQLTIQGGDMIWTLNTAPGRPQWSDAAPTPITISEVNAVFGSGFSLGDTLLGDIDPLITLADLDYVDG